MVFEILNPAAKNLTIDQDGGVEQIQNFHSQKTAHSLWGKGDKEKSPLILAANRDGTDHVN